MIANIKSCGLMGIDGYIVDVEIDISGGIPAFEIVGLPDAAVKEAKERVRSAIKNSSLFFPSKRIIINLAPAHLKKEGATYDLPITMAILKSTNQIDCSDEYMFLGELSLDGKLRRINGALPMVICAHKAGIKSVIVPNENAFEAAVVKGVEVFPAQTLTQIVQHFTGQQQLKPFKINIDDMFNKCSAYDVDFADVKGQENVKRALEIAAAGNHNAILIGSPGTGKTMIAQRLPTILPNLSFEEALEVTKIHSIAGMVPDNTPLISTRPFRNPHHTISASGLSGGGGIPKPGELSLSHHGVLFLDELPEFKKDVLEVMRQPLEDGKITISRVNATLTYPCNVMFVASMNPCKCGYYGDNTRECHCKPSQIQTYLSKISGPLLDRIDIHVQVSSVKYKDLENTVKGESSLQIKSRVDAARKIQLDRYKDMGIYSNSQLKPKHMNSFCKLGKNENDILKTAFNKLGLSARAHNRVLKVARTIADLAGSEQIQTDHLAEAIQYRSLDRNIFK